MKTLGKCSLFMMLVLAFGCGKKKLSDGPRALGSNPSTSSDRVEAQEKEVEEEGSLESRCFEGDIEACDELGH